MNLGPPKPPRPRRIAEEARLQVVVVEAPVLPAAPTPPKDRTALIAIIAGILAICAGLGPSVYADVVADDPVPQCGVVVQQWKAVARTDRGVDVLAPSLAVDDAARSCRVTSDMLKELLPP